MEKEFKIDVQLKNQNKTTLTIKMLENGTNDNFYDLRCYNDAGQEMGFVTFKITNNNAWLYKIETHSELGHQGAGTALIQSMEYILSKNKVRQVEAKYHPDNEFALPFYLKNGYYVPNQKRGWDDYDETWRMFKIIDNEKIKKDIEPNIHFEKAEAEPER